MKLDTYFWSQRVTVGNPVVTTHKGYSGQSSYWAALSVQNEIDVHLVKWLTAVLEYCCEVRFCVVVSSELLFLFASALPFLRWNKTRQESNFLDTISIATQNLGISLYNNYKAFSELLFLCTNFDCFLRYVVTPHSYPQGGVQIWVHYIKPSWLPK